MQTTQPYNLDTRTEGANPPIALAGDAAQSEGLVMSTRKNKGPASVLCGTRSFHDLESRPWDCLEVQTVMDVRPGWAVVDAHLWADI